MPRMPAQRLPATDLVILGPCPGCSVWTLEYDSEVRASYDDFELAVESLLQDHLDACPGLRELLS